MINIDLQLFSEDIDADDWGDIEADVVIDESTDTDEIVTEQPDSDDIEADTDTPTEDAPVVPKYKLKHNHEDKEFTLDELTQLGQKGLNYDKILEKVTTLESSPERAYVENMAKLNGMTVPELIQAWTEADEKSQVEELAYRDEISPEAAQRIFRAEKAERESQSKLDAIDNTNREAEKQRKEYLDFFTENPQMTPETIPSEVWAYKERTGRDLTSAMMWFENQQAKNELKLLKQTAENQQRSPGTGGVTNYGATKTSKDDFDSGWDS